MLRIREGAVSLIFWNFGLPASTEFNGYKIVPFPVNNALQISYSCSRPLENPVRAGIA